MIIFAVYAVLVWMFTMKHRRRWLGFAAPVAGAIIAAGLTWLAKTFLPTLTFIPLSVLLWGEVSIVLLVGLYIACLPRGNSSTHHECWQCRYDLAGLNPSVHVCPECGAAQGGYGESGKTEKR